MIFAIKILISLLAIYIATGHCRSKHARENEAYVLECREDDENEIATVTWYRFCKIISPNKERRVHANGKKLLFLPAAMSDAGIYICTIQTKSNNESKSLSLVIHESKGNCSGLPIYPYPTEVESSIIIICPDIDMYENTNNFSWYKDCKKFPKEVYHNSGTVLHLDSTTGFDSGVYNCRFIYEYNGMMYTVNRFKSVSFTASSICLDKSFATPKYREIEVALHEPINIPCSVFIGYNCFDFSDVYWKINGTNVADFNSSRFQEEKRKNTTSLDQDCIESTLRISKVEEEDFNYNFTCIARHKFKSQHSTVIFKYPGKDFTVHIVTPFTIFFLMSGAMYLFYIYYRVDAVLLFRKIFAKGSSRDDGKKFDAYVIYPRHSPPKDEDTEYFVTHILTDVLENKCGYKIYIPGRNNIPGEDVANCALKNIEKSRRLIIILTAEIQAIETLYEQQVGLHNALINNNVKVMIITMGNISGQNEMQESLRHIVNKKGTIKWDKSNINLSPHCKFWKLVRYHMP